MEDKISRQPYSFFRRTKWKIGVFGVQNSQLEDILRIGGHLCPMVGIRQNYCTACVGTKPGYCTACVGTRQDYCTSVLHNA